MRPLRLLSFTRGSASAFTRGVYTRKELAPEGGGLWVRVRFRFRVRVRVRC